MYLARGITMLRSLRRLDRKADVLVLALDNLSAPALRDEFKDGVRVIETDTLHAAVPQLRTIRSQRSTWAYYATQKPALALFAMESETNPQWVMSVDADTWFFADPRPMFDEIGRLSVAISPHRFPTELRHLAIFGAYNAGCIYWRNDATGRRCLAEWRDECLAWCAEEPQPDGRFMNQGYLNLWPQRYPEVHILRHPGANLAPWNVDGHCLQHRRKRVIVDGQSLIFYHFHALSRDDEGSWYSHFPHLERQFSLVWDSIYHPYLLAVETESRRLLDVYGTPGIGTVRPMTDWPTVIPLGRVTPPSPSRISLALHRLKRRFRSSWAPTRRAG